MNCEQCQSNLFEFSEGGLDRTRRREIDLHLEHCEACSRELADIWQMQMMASRWRDERVPHYARRRLFFDEATWLPRLQLAGSFASILVLILVLADFRISGDGPEFGFARNYVDSTELTKEMAAFRRDQQSNMDSRLEQLADRQLATNQLLLRTVLRANREERREELASVVTLLDRQEDLRAEETRESLRYLIASQVEDRRNIQLLNEALVRFSGDTDRF